ARAARSPARRSWRAHHARREGGAAMIRAALALLVGAATLALLLRSLDLAQLGAALGATQPAPLLAAVACCAAGNLLEAARWRLLFPPPAAAPGLWPLFRAVVVAQAVNNVVPLRAGDLARVGALGRGRTPPLATTVGTVAAEKALDLAAALALLPLALLWGLPSAAPRPLAVALAVLLALALLLALVPARMRVGDRRPPFHAGRAPLRHLLRAAGWLESTRQAARAGLAPRRLPLLVALTAAGWALAAATNGLVFRALQLALPPAAALL